MTLENIEIIAGVVVDSNDPMNSGRVKAVVPGFFEENDDMTIDDFLWICPAIMFGYQTFTKMMKGSKVWVLHNKNNYFSFWYLPMFELNENTAQAIQQNSDVVVSRSGKQMYFNDSEGFVQKSGDNLVTLDKTGNYIVNSNDLQISAKDSKVSIGMKDGANQAAVLGGNLIDLLNTISTYLMNIGSTLATTPYTVPASQQILELASFISNNTNSLVSKNVFIN